MNLKECKKSCFRAIFLVIYVSLSPIHHSSAAGACDRSRKVFEGVSHGEITDGLNANYTQDSHCEWLIRADNGSQFITLKFLSLKTECSYDYIFIYDGDSYSSPLIGSFSGQTDPQDVTAFSGSMLILLYSDTNYNLDGFRAVFSVTNCLNNCSKNGLCSNHKCLCTGDWSGIDCGTQICNCGDAENRGFCHKNGCKCLNDYTGQSCSLHKFKAETSQWFWLTNGTQSFTPRAAHTAVYSAENDELFVFGGYDLNRVLGAMEIFQFKENRWIDGSGKVLEMDVNKKAGLKKFLLNSSVSDQFWFRAALLSHVNAPEIEETSQTETPPQIEPSPRYGHAACSLNNSFIIYGGKLADGSLSNELWLFNVSTRLWSIKAQNSTLIPPRLTRHALTYVPSNNYIYLFGGSLENSEFSSKMFRINAYSLDEWEFVYPRGGKSFDYRVVAHSMNYHNKSNSLLIYGGIIAGVARFSKLSDRMFSFSLNDNHWTEIYYPRTALREMSIPRERAFHTATIAGDILIVFGGYSHRHNKEESQCYDNQMYFYHLDCHAWINQEALGGQRGLYPKKQGVFAHAAVLRGDNTLLLVGGYHGVVNNDLLAFTLPDMMVPSRNASAMSICSKYKSTTECISNPVCGWCQSDSTCYDRAMSFVCSGNLQTTRCHGICPSLRDCQSCLVHGEKVCKWCVQNAKCHQINDREPCGDSDFVEKFTFQWWGSSGVTIDDKTMCLKLDRPPGLTYLKYLYPYDWNMPDSVSIINSTLVEFNTNTAPSIDSSNSGEVLARLNGFLHLPDAYKDQIRVCGSYADINLKISEDKASIASFLADQNLCHSLNMNEFADRTKVLIDLQARRQQKSQLHLQSRVSMQNNATKTFTFEYLEPFSSGNCASNKNCFQCLSDNLCAWCDVTEECMPRNVNETSACSDGINWRYLTLRSEQCVNCSNFISCQACSLTETCEWWNEDAKCERRGRSLAAIKDPTECASPCHERSNCSSCLNDKGKCVWCQATSQCFSFSVYTSEFQFGLCREWIDQLMGTSDHSGHHQCKSCAAYKNCSTCLKRLSCGWCYLEDNPIEGACVDGDFAGPSMPCNVSMNSTEVTLYKYANCPDVDECGLGIHDCHINANCINTHGSFNCQCMKGYIGDGKKKCDKTCNETCINGICSNYPDYTCLCDLGWTGNDCSVNCGCNNHSTCRNGTRLCDECKDNTEGEFCERCKIGSYGDATSARCISCNCNDHGDESRGLCDQKSGKCFCLDNTEGENCETCANGFYGNPRNGGRCYSQCQSRGILKMTNGKSQGIGSFRSQSDVTECLWLLKLNQSLIEGGFIRFEVNDDMNVSCNSNAIYVYNSISELSEQKKLLNVICREENFFDNFRESRTGEIAVYFHKNDKNEGFNGIISIYSCQLKTCLSPFICDKISNCVCPPGTRGLNCEVEICRENCTNGICDMNSNKCICNDSFGGEDCSLPIKPTSIVAQELFSTLTVAQNLNHLKKTLPRFGHTVNADRRGYLWIFGGYSLSNGALNDIRQFDTKNHTWMQVTVDGSDTKMPTGRYFHAAEITKHSIYVYGGIGNDYKVLNDFWMFNIQEQRWSEVETSSSESPGALAGHTMTIIKVDESERLLIIGGYKNISRSDVKSTEVPLISHHNHQIVWEFDFDEKAWKKLNTSGSSPAVIYGHTSSYHSPKQVLYIFGGYQFGNGTIDMTNRLYSLTRTKDGTWTWNFLPIFNELNRAEENLPRARFLHSAIAFQNYLLIYSGQSKPSNSSDLLNIYSYKCNSYLRLTDGLEIIGSVPASPLPQAIALETDSNLTNTIYSVGGIASQFSIHKISLPSDVCQLFSTSKHLCRQIRGCSFATIANFSSKSNLCFTSEFIETTKNSFTFSTVNAGSICDEELIGDRSCNFTMCKSCAAVFPGETFSPCRWNAADKRCYRDTRLKNESFCEREPSKCRQQECVVSDFHSHHEIECASYDNCTTCLAMNDTCSWSMKIQSCVMRSFTPLLCVGATCGAVLTSLEECPITCESHTMCSKCLLNSNCGWCSKEGNGNGNCIEGSLDIENCENGSSWNFLTCPPENECTNGHHNCNKTTETCVDLEHGFECVCGEGYKNVDGDCLPICKDGCFHGTCVHPNVCKCDFGFVGHNCSIACKCSGHSDCAGPNQLDKCLECKNNTKGAQCEKCEKFHVKVDGRCESCNNFCNGHSNICVSSDLKDFNGTIEELEEIVSEGPTADNAICLNCGNFTSDRQCQNCLRGYFRGTTLLTDACRRCNCNGHGDICDPVTGEKCNCGNNTESDQTCPTSSLSGKAEKNSVYHCWLTQCAKCKESYQGHPKNGHQCFKHISIESRMCFNDAKPIDECERHLEAGKTQFFLIQPRYMNVDIRIVIDVTVGEIDLQMSSHDDTFVINTNQSNGFHEIYLDSRYHWAHEILETPLLLTPLKRGIDATSYTYQVVDRVAKHASLATHITLAKGNSLLRVFGMKNRLIITLPQSVHELSKTRFYIAVRAVNHAVVTTGLIYFRQDQLHIDLFVFFSVFFSCFFLFLAVCVVVWKAKQAADMRRARQRHVVEMLNMAQRPYSSVLLDVSQSLPLLSRDATQNSRPKTKITSNHVPVAIETTADNIAAVCTIFVKLPGQKRRPICLASALIAHTKQNMFLNKPPQRIAQQNV